MKVRSHNLSRVAFRVSATLIALGSAFLYGAVASRSNLPPIPQLQAAYQMVREVLFTSDRILETSAVIHDEPVATLMPSALQPGLVLVAGDVADRETAVRIIDRDGLIVHEWRPKWREIWTDEEGDFPNRPVEGMYLHGMELLDDGSLVANFEHQSTFRVDACGNVLWKLDNLGHHSVHLANDGTLWVSAEDRVSGEQARFPNHVAPIRSWTLQNISLDGVVLESILVIDVLRKSGLEGLLYLSGQQNGAPIVTGDTLHLNDVETFPEGLQSEFFRPGDLLISLRNINAIMVLDRETHIVKYLSIGGFVRQHDPDFIAGDRISVFDNRSFTLADEAGPPSSRIVEIAVGSGDLTTVLDGRGKEPFFSEIMGVHQRLENGNILVVPSGEGRVLEFTASGDLAWRYDNRVEPRLNRRVYMARVLPLQMNEAFFKGQAAKCRERVQR
jgi:hypothetical protein